MNSRIILSVLILVVVVVCLCCVVGKSVEGFQTPEENEVIEKIFGIVENLKLSADFSIAITDVFTPDSDMYDVVFSILETEKWGKILHQETYQIQPIYQKLNSENYKTIFKAVLLPRQPDITDDDINEEYLIDGNTTEDGKKKILLKIIALLYVPPPDDGQQGSNVSTMVRGTTSTSDDANGSNNQIEEIIAKNLEQNNLLGNIETRLEVLESS